MKPSWDQNCETACPIWNAVVVVIVYTDTGDQTPRQFCTSSSGATGQSIIDTSVDGRPAILVTYGATYPLQYIVKDGARMFRVAYQLYTDRSIPAGASEQKLRQILESFRFGG